MKQPVYFDCDNTMGLPGCDMDDGMALLYLLGQPQVQIRALTTSFGNSAIEKVHRNTERMFQELHLDDIPLKKGAPSPQQRESEASSYLSADIRTRKEQVKLLVTGSPTNIYAACRENDAIFQYIDEMIFMGGITEPLIIGGRPMNELNFSSDPQAMHYLMRCPVNTTIISAQLCLAAFFDQPKMDEVLHHPHYPVYAYLREPLTLWYDFISAQYQAPGFHVWDIVAAVYLTHPSLFDRREVAVTSTVEDLRTGFLRIDPASDEPLINLPTKIHDLDRFWSLVFSSWQQVTL
jgi:inosine-uridine nucleoside N-ribohydrolase